MSLIKEVVGYLRNGRAEFHRIASVKEQDAEEAYQGSMKSAMQVTREARRVRTNADFIREVLKHHG